MGTKTETEIETEMRAEFKTFCETANNHVHGISNGLPSLKWPLGENKPYNPDLHQTESLSSQFYEEQIKIKDGQIEELKQVIKALAKMMK